MESLSKPECVIPAHAGIQEIIKLDPGFRRGDELFRVSFCQSIRPCCIQKVS